VDAFIGRDDVSVACVSLNAYHKEETMDTYMRHAGVAMLCLLCMTAAGRVQDQFFDANGVRLRYVEQGSGDAVVLVHGNGSTLNAWMNAGVLPQLAQEYRVIALDVRGHGKSDKPHDVHAYGREMGLDIIRLLDHLGIRRAHIIGYSMGASITAPLLTTHAERFLSATLGGGAGRWRWTEAQAAAAEQEAAERERECVSRSQMSRLAPTNGPKPDEAEIQRRSAACMANPHQDRFALAALARSRKESVITPAQVAAVTVPTLGIVGSLDGVLTSVQELKHLRPEVQLVVIEGATHGGERGAMRRPEFLAAVRAFLASHRTASAR
jgi:pimeloyl-ACP methyl ester carboxylesterase